MLWYFDRKNVFKFGFEKRGVLTKFHFYIKRSTEISGKGLLHFYQEKFSLVSKDKYVFALLIILLP